MAQTSRDCDGNDASHLATPPMRDSTREPRENHLERSRFHIPVNEACAGAVLLLSFVCLISPASIIYV